MATACLLCWACIALLRWARAAAPFALLPLPTAVCRTFIPLVAEVPFDDEDRFVEVLKKAGLTEG